MSLDAGIYPQSDAPGYAEIQEQLSEAALSGLPVMRIAILRNVMVDSIVPYVRYFAYRLGFRAEVKLGEYDNIVQESLAGSGGSVAHADYVLVFAYLETLAPGLTQRYATLSSDQATAECESVRAFIRTALQGIRRQSGAMILWHAFERPLNPSLGILDAQSGNGQTGMVAELNDYLRAQLKEAGNAYLVDTNLCLGRVGAKTFYDPRYWHIGKAPYSREGLRELTRECFKFIRPRAGKSKKCLVLDCDNTLWGGILGEDGIQGIELGTSYPGSAYRGFQEEILNLHERGVLIALCSKNNEQDVWEVFDAHPDMLLKRAHIASAQINWLDKAANLRQIAKELNIGLDSLVFVDDSAFEVNLVRSLVPEVEAILLPKDRSVEYRSILASCGLFEGLTVSQEDRTRGAMYAAERQRRALATNASDLEAYYRSLAMVADIRLADDIAVPRVAQQTQKTNQFNLTTRRYAEGEIRKLATAKESDVVCLRLADSFGDMGIVGACILRYAGTSAVIDTFLLSCRALGRGAEDVFLLEVLACLKRRGIVSVRAEYIPTAKNEQVSSFYARHGFQVLLEEGSTSTKYELALDHLQASRPEYFQAINSQLG